MGKRFNLILEFGLDIQQRSMKTTWPKPGYLWKGLGTIDYLVEHMFGNEDEEGKATVNIPDVPSDLLNNQEKFICYKYQTPYPAFLVDQFCQLMHTTPNYTPEQILVSRDQFQAIWNKLKPTLIQYMQTHFKERPPRCLTGLLLDRCKAAILVVAEYLQLKPQKNVAALAQVIQNVFDEVTDFHQNLMKELQNRDGLFTSSSVTIQMVESPPLDSSGSNDKEEKRKKQMQFQEEKINTRVQQRQEIEEK